MLKHTKCLLGATFFYFTTVTVVYGNTPKELCQNRNNVLSKLCEEVRVDENYEVLLPESTIKNFIINKIAQPSTPLPTPTPGTVPTTKNQNSWQKLLSPLVAGWRTATNNLLMRKPFDQQSVDLATVNMENPYIMERHAEKLFPSIVNEIATNLPHLRATKLAMIPGSYDTIAQSESTQPTDNDILIRRNLYIDIRTKLTYFKTFSDSIRAMKKMIKYPYSKIRNQVRSDLENNINELSDYEILEQQFYASIPDLNNKDLITEQDKKFVEFATQQIKKADEIPGLEKAVSDTMNQNLEDSVELITSLVNQELKLTCRVRK